MFRVHRWGNDRFLVMVEGARQDTTEAVMAKFPTVDIVSRDRGSAYAAAADASGKLQVADPCHLIDNLHEAIKTALALTLGSDGLFLKATVGSHPSQEMPRKRSTCRPGRCQKLIANGAFASRGSPRGKRENIERP